MVRIKPLRLINRKDIHGVQLREGDIVAETTIGKEIWGGKGIVLTRPLGLVVCYSSTPSKMLPPEETDCYNITQIRKGSVQLTDKADDWMIDHMAGKDRISELNISRYDGDFYAWSDIEIIGNVFYMDK